MSLHSNRRAPRLDDPALNARLQSGDEAAFKLVFDTYWDALCAFASRYVADPETAEDIVQSVFARLAQHPQSYNAQTSLSAYLYAATRNAALDIIRHDQIREKTSQLSGALDAVLPSPSSTDASLTNAEIAQTLHDVMLSLSPRVRLVAMHRLYDGLSRSEIATLLGVSEETIHKQLGTAMTTLRSRLKHLR